jgi:hypothetical protein
MSEDVKPDREQVRQVKEQVEDELLHLPGVTGVDVGYKIVGGQKTDTLAIRVYVQKKQDAPAGQEIPTEIQGVPTDVIERRYVLHSAKAESQKDNPNQ